MITQPDGNKVREPSPTASIFQRQAVVTGFVFCIFACGDSFLGCGSGVAREKARAPNCISNLKALSTAITMYSDDDKEGRMPSTLRELANGTYLPVGSTAYQCPKSQQNFSYPGAARLWQVSGDEISIHCNSDHLGKKNALLNDGRVAPISPEELKRYLAELEKSEKEQMQLRTTSDEQIDVQ